MATVSIPTPLYPNAYPTTDHKPMAETDWHRDLMQTLIETLKAYFAAWQRVYVSGNLLMFYEPGNRRRHVSPDVFVVRGVPNYQRPNYLVWEEGRAPQVVIELTSSTTRNEDLRTKFRIYQDILRVREYFLFDPLGDFLKPRMQGFRLRQKVYRPIRLTHEGRLPSQALGLLLEPSGRELRLVDSGTGKRLLTPQEIAFEAEAARFQAEAARNQAESEMKRAAGENQRLLEEIAELRRQLGKRK